MNLSVQVFSLYKHIRVYFLLIVFCNSFQIDSETLSSVRGFFLQGFPRKFCVFPLFCISLLCR